MLSLSVGCPLSLLSSTDLESIINPSLDFECEDLLFFVVGSIFWSGIFFNFIFLGILRVLLKFLFTVLTEFVDFTVVIIDLVILLDALSKLSCCREDCLVVLIDLGSEDSDLFFFLFGAISCCEFLLSFLFTGFLFALLTVSVDFTFLVFLGNLEPLSCGSEDCLVVLIEIGAIFF